MILHRGVRLDGCIIRRGYMMIPGTYYCFRAIGGLMLSYYKPGLQRQAAQSFSLTLIGAEGHVVLQPDSDRQRKPRRSSRARHLLNKIPSLIKHDTTISNTNEYLLLLLPRLLLLRLLPLIYDDHHLLLPQP